jgi:predicted SAM-dependent methyltransferase
MKLVPSANKIFLDVGCGPRKQHGFIGMDNRDLPEVDIVHDLEVFPWPMEDNSVCFIRCCHVIEHIKPWLQIDFMNECWRVLGHGDFLAIATPYGGSPRYLQDPTHCSPWTEYTVAYFIPGNELYDTYEAKPWDVEHISFENPYDDIEVVYRAVKDGQDEHR